MKTFPSKPSILESFTGLTNMTSNFKVLTLKELLDGRRKRILKRIDVLNAYIDEMREEKDNHACWDAHAELMRLDDKLQDLAWFEDVSETIARSSTDGVLLESNETPPVSRRNTTHGELEPRNDIQSGSEQACDHHPETH